MAVHRLQTHGSMRALLLLLLASAGCAFDAPEGSSPDDPADDPAANPPAGSDVCDRNDPTLKLCVDFSAPLADRSSRRVRVEATRVDTADRDGKPAALLAATSSMHIHEDPDLDLDVLTLDAWIRPSGTPVDNTHRYWILDNNTQYAASFTELRKVRCVIGSQYVDSDPLADDGTFHHVACAYNGTQVRVYIDGDLIRCAQTPAAIKKDGTSGLAIGANVSGPDLTPMFAESFIGGIDDVRLWSRSDLDICALSGKTGCRTVCPLAPPPPS